MSRTKALIALAAGGLVALLLVGSAMAHPGGIVDRVDVLARALGITAGDVEQARADGTLKSLLADVTKDDLKTAYTTEASAAIDGAEDDGDITATQATRLRDRYTADRTEFTDAEIAELRGLRDVVTVDRVAVLASALGMTSEEVEAAKEDGTLRDTLAGVDRVTLAAALVDAWHDAIDDAEDAGDITAEQAELLRDAAGPGGHKGRGHDGCAGKARGDWGDNGRGNKKGSTDAVGDSP